MTDLTKCIGFECPKKEKCLRFTIEPTEDQSYFYEHEEGKDCMFFIPNKEEDNADKTRNK